MAESNIITKKKKTVIECKYDVAIESAITEEVNKAVTVVAQKCSEEYKRNVRVTVAIDVN